MRSSSTYDTNDEELYYDEETLDKVKRSIGEILSRCVIKGVMVVEPTTNDIIEEIQNSGILFRERR